MKRLLCCLVTMAVLLTGCGQSISAPKQYTATFLTLFDTVTTIMGPGATEADFQEQAQQIHDQLLFYHQLFDIYNEYEGLNNLKTLNDEAGESPVTVEPAIIRLLSDCKSYYELTGGKVNAAMGSVLSLWHDARSDGIRDPRNAKLPDLQKLEQAAGHMDFDDVILDEEASTVFFRDPQLKLDVGAIAKGWATREVAKNAPEGFLISVGGNVCATGPKGQDVPWIIGIQDPDGEGNLHTVYLSRGAVVTSGDYQRTYQVEGKAYHHIIDPETKMPARYWRSVTVVCPDSGLADALSTALFLLPLEQGEALALQSGAEVFWVDTQGEEYMTPGFQEMIRT